MASPAGSVERRYPVIELTDEDAGRLLARVPDLPAPIRTELLLGGHVNSNYAVWLEDGRRAVVRLYAGGEACRRAELEALRAVAGSLPVPQVYLSLGAGECIDHPCALLQWIEGGPLDLALRSRPADAKALGRVVARVLVQIGEHALPGGALRSPRDSMRAYLFEGALERHLGHASTSKLRGFVAEHAELLENQAVASHLVHGDFQGDNILVRPRDGGWVVAGILDWEWAHEGCPLADLGSLLRFDGEASVGFALGLEEGYAAEDAPLPPDWRRSARIWDLLAQCEKLSDPRDRGEVTRRSVRIIERCLEDYAS